MAENGSGFKEEHHDPQSDGDKDTDLKLREKGGARNDLLGTFIQDSPFSNLNTGKMIKIGRGFVELRIYQRRRRFVIRTLFNLLEITFFQT